MISLLAACGGDSSDSESRLVAFTGGWYNLESSERDEWRWSNGEATININNDSSREREVLMRFSVRSLTPRTIRAQFNGDELFADALAADFWLAKEIPLILPAGSSTVTFHSPQEGVTSPGDTRSLAFCVRNFEVVKR